MTNIIGISGWSGSGKTHLISNLIKFFVEKHHLKVCALKHAHSSFQIDHEGKDSYKFFESGASRVVISSSKQWAMVNKVEGKELSLETLLKFSNDKFDLILVEGWKLSKIKKIEVFRDAVNKPLLSDKYENFVAVATNSKKLTTEKNLPILNLNDVKEIGCFILNYLRI